MPVPVYMVQGLVGRHAGVAGWGPRSAVPLWDASGSSASYTTAWGWCGRRGQVVSLVGPPGMGKTRLLTEFERRLAPDQVPWFGGQCLAYGQAPPPYLPVCDLLQQLCGLVEGDRHAARTAGVQHRLHARGIRREETVALLSQLLDLPVAPNPRTAESRPGRPGRLRSWGI